jgi:aspartate racemase
MKTVGIIGGIGPESTIAYYRLIISSYREHKQDGNYPHIVINSINMKRMLDLIGDGKLKEVAIYLSDEVKKLADAGADLGLLASNTPHIFFDDLRAASPIPLLSIVEATCREAVSLGLKRVGLFGTKFTMQSQFYQEVFSRRNMSIVVPRPADQDYIHEKYMSELVNGIILSETKGRLLEIVRSLKEQEDIQGLILGGTELPLILKETDDKDIPFLDTTSIHVEAIIEQLVESA